MEDRQSAFLKETQKAKNAAFNYLKIRPRSTGEMQQKLRDKGFSQEIIDDIVVFLTEYNFLNDQEFARAWIQYRLHKPYGPQRIKMELRQKRIDPEIVEQQLQQTLQEYNEEAVVRECVEGRLARLAQCEPEKKRRRLFDFLSRKGFSLSTINKVLRSYDWK